MVVCSRMLKPAKYILILTILVICLFEETSSHDNSGERGVCRHHGYGEACRVVERVLRVEENPVKDQQSDAPAADEDTLAKTEAETGFPDDAKEDEEEDDVMYDDAKNRKIVSHLLCDCPVGSHCPGENDTDTSREINIDKFLTLKLCQPKSAYAACRDFRRPIIRLHKQFKHSETSDNEELVYKRAQVWCRCETESYAKRRVEVWNSGSQHVVPISCNRNKPS